MENVVTPVDVDKLEELLVETNYDRNKTKSLVDGFRYGFRLGYQGNRKVKMKSPNLKFREVGNEIELWNKVMKEVKLKRYVGPYDEPPFEYFIQSPIGLVPKDGGKSTRLIFHLSYPRGTNKSVNANIDKKACTVQYPDFSEAIKLCLQAGKCCFIAKSDMTSAFRQLGMSKLDFCLMVMKPRNPETGRFCYFVDKCLPFGASISCALFQAFSNAVAHIVKNKTGRELVNYLDDYMFAALMKLICNAQVEKFLEICELIRFPISMEKTYWGSTTLTFLGLLIDTVRQLICLPKEKIDKALEKIGKVLNKPKKKITIHELQKICGLLNFLGQAIIPGRAFTRRLYAYTSGKPSLKPHHHIRITSEMRLDLELWRTFLNHQMIFSRSFMDVTKIYTAQEVEFYSDASKNPKLGMGAVCQNSWIMQQWNESFIRQKDPSIEYLELYALGIAVVQWINRFSNKRIVIFCDNISVVHMINNTSSNCKHCMSLIRVVLLHCLIANVRIYAKYIPSKLNVRSDLLSRLKLDRFKREFPYMEENATEIPAQLWPMEKIWTD